MVQNQVVYLGRGVPGNTKENPCANIWSQGSKTSKALQNKWFKKKSAQTVLNRFLFITKSFFLSVPYFPLPLDWLISALFQNYVGQSENWTILFYIICPKKIQILFEKQIFKQLHSCIFVTCFREDTNKKVFFLVVGPLRMQGG